MNKKFLIIFIFVLSLFIFPSKTYADYNAVVVDDSYPCELETYLNSTGRCVYTDNTLTQYNPGLFWLDRSDEVYVFEDDRFDSPNLENCSDYFVKVEYHFPATPDYKYYGYFCHAALMRTDEIENESYIEEFKNAGFPESYWKGLLMLKTNHPNWNFVAANTGLDFYDAVYNESVGGRSVIRTSTARNSNYAYAAYGQGAFDYINDKYIPYDDITGADPWIQANLDTIAYYMDPRNFLVDMYIFQFESLIYNSNIDDNKYKESIAALLENDYLKAFTDIFVEAGKQSGVNPIYLASLSKQEVSGGEYPTTAIRGDYNGMYNFYNIGASDGENPVIRGLIEASYEDASTLRPWDTEEKAIIGGAKWIYKWYLGAGQSTSYFKRFNVIHDYIINNNISDFAYDNFYHQYMTNLLAPTEEALLSFRSYKINNSIDNEYTFLIPIYNNMPEYTSLPTKGGWPNNYLNKLIINGQEIVSFNPEVEDYNYNLDINNPVIKIEAEAKSNTATITGLDTYTINADQIINITVIAGNGEMKTYNIHVKLVGEKIEEPIPEPTPTPEPEPEPTIPKLNIQETLNKTDIKNNDTYLSGFTVGDDISIIEKKIKNVNNDAVIKTYNSKGEEKTSGQIATGDKVKIVINGEIKEYYIVIFGDVSGDGKIKSNDYGMIVDHVLNKKQIEGIYLKASDVSRDGKIKSNDYGMIVDHVLNKKQITQ